MSITCRFTSLDGAHLNSGLGNMLFQIATIHTIARDNNAEYSFPYLKTYYEIFGDKYKNNIFRKLPDQKIRIRDTKSYDWNYENIEYKI